MSVNDEGRAECGTKLRQYVQMWANAAIKEGGCGPDALPVTSDRVLSNNNQPTATSGVASIACTPLEMVFSDKKKCNQGQKGTAVLYHSGVNKHRRLASEKEFEKLSDTFVQRRYLMTRIISILEAKFLPQEERGKDERRNHQGLADAFPLVGALFSNDCRRFTRRTGTFGDDLSSDSGWADAILFGSDKSHHSQLINTLKFYFKKAKETILSHQEAAIRKYIRVANGEPECERPERVERAWEHLLACGLPQKCELKCYAPDEDAAVALGLLKGVSGGDYDDEDELFRALTSTQDPFKLLPCKNKTLQLVHDRAHIDTVEDYGVTLERERLLQAQSFLSQTTSFLKGRDKNSSQVDKAHSRIKELVLCVADEATQSIFDMLKRIMMSSTIDPACVEGLRSELRDLFQGSFLEAADKAAEAFPVTGTMAMESQPYSAIVGTDLYASKGTASAARLAAGAVVHMALEVCKPDNDEEHATDVGKAAKGGSVSNDLRSVQNGFVLTRPPGHHSGADHASGFCYFNNVAVAARAAQNRYPNRIKKVLIVDWDVHHGDGTEQIFSDDPTVLTFSVHQHGSKLGHEVRKRSSIEAVQQKARELRLQNIMNGLKEAEEEEGEGSAAFLSSEIIASAVIRRHLDSPLLTSEDSNSNPQHIKHHQRHAANGTPLGSKRPREEDEVLDAQQGQVEMTEDDLFGLLMADDPEVEEGPAAVSTPLPIPAPEALRVPVASKAPVDTVSIAPVETNVLPKEQNLAEFVFGNKDGATKFARPRRSAPTVESATSDLVHAANDQSDALSAYFGLNSSMNGKGGGGGLFGNPIAGNGEADDDEDEEESEGSRSDLETSDSDEDDDDQSDTTSSEDADEGSDTISFPGLDEEKDAELLRESRAIYKRYTSPQVGELDVKDKREPHVNHSGWVSNTEDFDDTAHIDAARTHNLRLRKQGTKALQFVGDEQGLGSRASNEDDRRTFNCSPSPSLSVASSIFEGDVGAVAKAGGAHNYIVAPKYEGRLVPTAALVDPSYATNHNVAESAIKLPDVHQAYWRFAQERTKETPFYPYTGGIDVVGNEAPSGRWLLHGKKSKQKQMSDTDDAFDEEALLDNDDRSQSSSSSQPSDNSMNLEEMIASGAGRNVNAPWPCHGFGDIEYLQLFHSLLMPMIDEFEPDLIIVACGFDSAKEDNLGSMQMTPSGYYYLTRMLMKSFEARRQRWVQRQQQAKGSGGESSSLPSCPVPRLLVALEGGYNLKNVALGAEAVLRGLMEESADHQKIVAAEEQRVAFEQYLGNKSAYDAELRRLRDKEIKRIRNNIVEKSQVGAEREDTDGDNAESEEDAMVTKKDTKSKMTAKETKKSLNPMQRLTEDTHPDKDDPARQRMQKKNRTEAGLKSLSLVVPPPPLPPTGAPPGPHVARNRMLAAQCKQLVSKVRAAHEPYWSHLRRKSED